ncbi:MAG: YkgJ family cysteine cluster protein [Treponema sp.]|nr:YkgJ family cysteine cluster protein [Treponema sp.]
MPEISEKTHFYSNGLKFTCTNCSSCCRYDSGFVFLSEVDLARLVKAFQMQQNDFINTYCRWVPSMKGNYELSLKEKPNYDCIFWKKDIKPAGCDNYGGCLVYDWRPLQCRAFPFWPSIVNKRKNWDITAQNCPGMGSGTLHSEKSIENWLSQRQNEPIMCRGNT